MGEIKLIKKKNNWIDVNTGIEYKLLTKENYNDAKHGLCEKYGKPILKNLGHPKRLYIATVNPIKFHYDKTIEVQFVLKKHGMRWDFTPYEVEEVLDSLNKNLSPSKIATKVGAPVEAIDKLINKLKETNGKRNKGDKTKAGRKSCTREKTNIRTRR